MDDASVTYVRASPQGSCLVIKRPDYEYVYVIWFDPIHGFPIFSGIHNFDIFASVNDAMKSIEEKNQIEWKKEAKFFTGAVIIGCKCVLSLITQVAKEPTKFLNKHDVFVVKESQAVHFDLISSKSNPRESKHLQTAFSDFKYEKGTFFSLTFDFSAPIGQKKNTDMIWNMSLRKPFDYLPFPNPCVELIQGYWKPCCTTPEVSIVMRRRRISCGNPTVYGVNERGDVVNETEVEVIASKRTIRGDETLSHVFYEMSTPIAGPQTEMVLPAFFDRVLNHLAVSNIVLVDLNHTEPGHSESSRASIIERAVKQIYSSFNIDFKKIDWDCILKEEPGGLQRAISVLCKDVGDIEKHGLRELSWDTGTPKLGRTAQNELVMFSCATGVDRCNAVSFFYATEVVKVLLNRFGCHEGSSSGILGLDENILQNIGEFFLKGGDIMCQMFCMTDSIQKSEILRCMKNKHVGNSPNKKQRIMEDRKYVLEDKDQITRRYELFTGTFEYGDKNSAMKDGVMCLSTYPGIHIINPLMIDPSIFGVRNATCILDTGDQPLVISLHRPAQITEIVFRTLRDKDTFPSTVSIYGGMYVNRMFPILTDLALVSNNVVARFRRRTEVNYNHTLDPNRFSPVRYLAFKFAAVSEHIEIGNIYVYGITHGFEQIDQSGFDKLPPILSSASLGDVVPHTKCVAVATKWETERLEALMCYKECERVMLSRRINPSRLSFDRLMQLHPKKLTEKARCGSCKKPAKFCCGMCGEIFCRECSSPNTVQDPKGRGFASEICTNCFRARTECNKHIILFEQLKNRMMLHFYPFIVRNKLVCDVGSKMRLPGSADRIPARLIYEAPVGKSGTLAESILGDTKELWDPLETFVLLTIMFRQPFKIRSIGVACQAPVIVEADGVEPLSFFPPATEHTIDIQNHIVRLRIKGENIRISQLSFFGMPRNAVIPPQLKVSEDRPRPSHGKSPNDPTHCIPQYDPNELKHEISLSGDTRVSGLSYESLQGVVGMRVLNQNSHDDEFFSFTFPVGCDGPVTVRFPSVLQCRELLIFYIPKENYRVPQLMRIHTDASMYRTPSIPTFVK